MTTTGKDQPLKGQSICGIGIIAIGVIHIAAHFLIPQARQAIVDIFRAGLVNTLGTDWAAANFSVLMSLVVGFLFIMTGILVYQTAKIPWRLPLSSAVVLSLIFLFVVIAGPNGGGWLGLPICGYLVFQGRKRSL